MLDEFEPIGGIQPTKPEPPKPVPVPNHSRSDAVKVGLLLPAAGAVGFLIVMGFLAAILFFVLKASEGGHERDHQHQEQFEQQDTRPIDSEAIKGAYLVFVLENTSPTVDQTEAMAAYDADKLTSLGMAGFRRYDEEQTEAKPYIAHANGRGLSTPAIFLVKNKQIVKAAAFTNRGDVERFLR